MKKHFTHILFLLLIFFGMSSCQKQPNANFTSDKSTYMAGETIHLTDVSTGAKHWKWTLPDGTTNTNKNLDYPTNINDLGSTQTFKLEVTSKNGRKKSSISHSFKVNQYMLPSDYFSVLNNGLTNNYKPTSKNYSPSGSNWLMQASLSGYPICGDQYLYILLAGLTTPTAGTYSIQPYGTTLTAGQATIYIVLCGNPDTPDNIKSLSGQLDISITNNGKVRAIFNNVSSTETGPSSVSISGDITSP